MKLIKKFTLGSAKTNCYLIFHNNEYILIDAPEEIEVVTNYLDENNIKLSKILLTHSHYDHIWGLNYLVEKNYINYKNIYCPDKEIFALYDSSRKGNLGSMVGKECIYKYQVTPLSEFVDEEIEIKYFTGHSLQSAIFIFHKDKVIFAGDVIFDEQMQKKYFVLIPTISKQDFISQIKKGILSLNDDYMIYAGHLSDVTVGQRKNENRFN